MAIQHDDLVAKDVALGAVRSYEVPNGFIYPQITPWVPVGSDEVIFQHISPQVSTLAPARAEDAESEMLQRDDLVGVGRASLIDWALKDSYRASDVTRWREYDEIAQQLGTSNFRTTIGTVQEDYQRKLAKDTALRRQNLDNRLEWLATQGLWTNQIAYNDGKISFTVPWGRPAAQDLQPPTNGTWDLATSDPIDDIKTINRYMENTYGRGFKLRKGWLSSRLVEECVNSDKFIARTGLVQTTTSSPVDPNYLIPGWGPAAALRVIEEATGVQFSVYDGYYTSRPFGSSTPVINRFTDDRDVILLPDDSAIQDLTDLGMGFAGMLTSPHAEGNWASGFYAWEQEKKDPWVRDMGTGVKAFPLFPNMQYSYRMRALA